MKRTYRLTAFLLALLMLVNLSATAMASGITLDELDIATYQELLADATEEDETPAFQWGYIETEKNFNDTSSIGSNLGTVPANSFVKVFGTENSMYKVEYNGQIGYVSAYATIPVCVCGDVSQTDPAMHDADCAYPKYFKQLANEKTAVELYALWNGFSAEEQAFVLAALKDTDEDKYAALCVLLNPPAKPEKTETTDDGTTVTVSGSMPENVQLKLEPVADETAVELLPGLSQLKLEYIALDIKLMQDGQIWQPSETVQVTISAADIGVDGDVVAIFHNHDGRNEYLGLYEIAGGKVTFDVDGFSCIVIVKGGKNQTCWVEDLEALETATERYAFLNEKYKEAATEFSMFMWHYADNHSDLGLVCICGIDAAVPVIYAPGDANHIADCPWNENKLPVNDNVSETVGDVTVSVNGAFPESVELNVSQATDEAISSYIPDISSISFRRIQLDISLMNANAEWEPSAPVKVTISVNDLGETGDTIALFRLHDGQVEYIGTAVMNNGSFTFTSDGFSYILGVNVSDECTDGADCGYADFVNKSIAEKEQALAALYNSSTFEYSMFIAHVRAYHAATADLCLCDMYDPATHHHGSYVHKGYQVEWDTFACPWAFKSLSVEEQAAVLLDKTEDERAPYLETLTGDQKAALDAFMNPDENPLEEEVVDGNGKKTIISVAGSTIPENARLNAAFADYKNIIERYKDVAPELTGIKTACKAFDITMVADGAAWQPGEGEMVAVTMNVEDIIAEGGTALIYHIHEETDGTTTVELMGPFRVENDKITFNMSRFSSVLVFDGKSDQTIEGVTAFYVAKFDQKAGNGKLVVLGAYYDSDGNTHLLAGSNTDYNKTLEQLNYLWIGNDSKPINELEVTGDDWTFSTLSVKANAEDDSLLAGPFTFDERCKSVLDFNLGKYLLNDTFEFGVGKLDQSTNSWGVAGTTTVYIDCEINKTVAQGTDNRGSFVETVTVDRGDWVIFKVDVKNSTDFTLSNLTLKDILPLLNADSAYTEPTNHVFDLGTVQVAIGVLNAAGNEYDISNWKSYSLENQLLSEGYESTPTTEDALPERCIYLKAQVRTDLPITTDTTYTNKATVSGANMPEKSDEAKITVAAPKQGMLTVSKAVTTANPNMPVDTNQAFTFTIGWTGTDDPLSYKVDGGSSASISNGGTFTLKHGQSAVFENVPAGNEITVTEKAVAGYVANLLTQKVTMQDQAAPVLAFENKYQMVAADLTIRKRLTEGTSDDWFTFNLTFEGEIAEEGYLCTIYNANNEVQSTENVTEKSTINLKADWRAEISGIPEGVLYTVTEQPKAGYELVNKDNAEGKIGNAAIEVLFINKPLTTSLTIEKTFPEGTNVEAHDTFVFQVDGKDANMQVVIKGAGSVTIDGLAVGQPYTVTEIGHSFRYEQTAVLPTSGQITLVTDAAQNKVTFTNERSTEQWLDANHYVENAFTGVANQ